MAKSRASLQKCFNLASEDVRNRLPANIQEAMKAGQKEMLAALEAHEAHLKSLLKEVVVQHKETQKGVIATLPATQFTQRPDDPDNELNRFRPIGGLKLLVKNLVQRAGNIYTAAKKFAVLSAPDEEALNHFNEHFLSPVSMALDDLFLLKEGSSKSFRQNDPIQYFVQQGQTTLPTAVKEAIAATLYEWLGKEASRTAMGLSESEINQLLNLGKDVPVPQAALNILGQLGTNTNHLAGQLGRTILERLAIQATDEAGAMAQKNMENSLGRMAIATMEKMELVIRQERNGKATDALAQGENLEYSDVIFDATSGQSRKGLLLINATKLVTDPDKPSLPLPLVQEIEANMERAPDVFDRLFNNESDTQNYSFTTVTLPKKVTAGRSSIEITGQQKENLQKYNDTQWTSSVPSMAAFEAMQALTVMPDTDPETINAFGTILGKTSMEGKLDIREKSVTSVNRDIDRAVQRVMVWLKQSRENKKSIFYIPNSFMNNMRMLMLGAINPQNSKLMRNLFAPKSWRKSFEPKYTVRKFANKQGTERAFLEAVAQALDIESAKEGGVDQQLEALDSLLNYPISEKDQNKSLRLWPAIYALQEFDESGKMTPQMVKDIAAGVEATGMKLHGFKGLQEYARYLNHKKLTTAQRQERGGFVTDIYKEIDGVSNGPIIGMLMFITNGTPIQERLAALSMGGISVSRVRQSLDEKIGPAYKHLNDAYQRMGHSWAKNILEVVQELQNAGNGLMVQKAKAIGNILGPFHDEGIVSKIVRNLSKPRTMQTTYGAGKTRQAKLFADIDLVYGGIYTKMESLIQDIEAYQKDPVGGNLTELEGRLDAFLKNVSMLVKADERHEDPWKREQYQNRDGSFDLKKLREFHLNKHQIFAVEAAVKETYGKAMGRAIDDVYKDIIEARKPLLDAVNASVIMYNRLLDAKLEHLKESKVQAALAKLLEEKKGKLHPKDEESIRANRKYTQPTKKELKQILDELAPVLPKIPTPLHTEEHPSYLQLVSYGKQKKYAEKDNLTQKYKNNVLVQMHGYPEGIPYLDAPGPSPIVRGIQMIDSMIANKLMGLDIDILNNHDGFSHAITDSDIIGEEANKELLRIMENYSLGGEIAQMHQRTMQAAKELLTEMGEAMPTFETLVNERLIDEKYMAEMLEQVKGVRAKATQEWIKERIKESQKKYEESYDASRKEALVALLDEHKLRPEEVVQERLEKLEGDALQTGKEVTENLQELARHVTHIAQYSNGGFGYTNPSADVETDQVFHIERDTVQDTDILASQELTTEIQALQKQVTNFFGSSEKSFPVATNQTASTVERVDSLNVSQVFETMAEIDEQSGYGSVTVSPEHKTHLLRILNDIVAKVMTPVKLYMGRHRIDQETQGVYEVDGQKIWLQLQHPSPLPQSGMLGHGIRMSAAETYVHEITHHILHAGFDKSDFLRRQAYNLYELARDKFEQLYGDNAFQVFMNDASLDLDDPNNADEIIAAKARWDYVFNPTQQKNKKHNGVHEFLTFGLTNENFKRNLAHLQMPKNANQAKFGIFEKNLQQTIVNLFNKVMDLIHAQFLKYRQSSEVNQELENLVRALSEVDTRAKSGVYAAFVKASNKMTAIGVAADTKVKDTVNKVASSTKVGQLNQKMKELRDKGIYDADNYLSYQARRLLNWYGDTHGQETFLQAVATEMKGLTTRLQPLHELLNRRNRELDAAKTEVAEGVRRSVNSWFKRELTSKEKTLYTEVGLKTDLSYLFHRKASPSTLIDLVGNNQAREDRIRALMVQLAEDAVLNPHRHFYEKAADDLGYFMVHSAARKDGVPLMNAHNIVAMEELSTVARPQGKDFARAMVIVEELSTLMALRYVPQADKWAMANLMRENWEAFENIMLMHNQLKQQALESSFHNQPGKMQKGYVKQILNDRIKYVQGTLADRAELTRMGYTMEAKPITRDPHDPVREDIYMFRSLTGMVNSYQSGIASLTGNTMRGQGALSLQHQIGNVVTPVQDADKNNQRMMNLTRRKLEQMYSATPRAPYKHTGTQNYMMPHFDDQGRMLGLRYMMNEHTKKTVLQQFGEIDAVLGAMSSQLIDKKVTPVINAELVGALKDFYDKEYEKFPKDFVDISPTSEDPVLREIYYRLPDKMRQTIYSMWGRHGMMVSKDVVTLAFGQSKYSIVNLFEKSPQQQKLIARTFKEVLTFALGWDNPLYKGGLHTDRQDSRQMRRDKQQGRAVVRARRIEETMMQLTNYAKTNIVVRNLKVIHGNYLSNISLLLSHGVPIHEILKGAREAINSALQYQKLHHRHQSVVIERKLLADKQGINAVDKAAKLKELDRIILRLEDELARNPSKIMIDAGLLPSIVDDVDTANVESPFTYGLDKALDTLLDKMPTKLEKATRTLFMTQDTEGFRMMNNAVKMTDYVGRYTLYKHLTQKKGMSHQEATNYAIDKFINFDLPTHKTLEYLNSVGLVFFSKYQLRVLKHIKNVLQEAPFTAMAVFLLGSFTGIGDNIINSIPGITKNLTQNFSTPWGAFMNTPEDILYVSLLGKVADATLL